jgi:hypothetical protein
LTVKVNWSALRRTRWYEYTIRFLFGGAATAITGLIVKKFGPEIGGLFLAFPAIMPAAVTLAEKHQIERKHEKGMHGTRWGRVVGGVDSAGAAMGSLGLMVFAVVVWKSLPRMGAAIVVPAATGLWLITAVAVWWLRKRIDCR